MIKAVYTKKVICCQMTFLIADARFKAIRQQS